MNDSHDKAPKAVPFKKGDLYVYGDLVTFNHLIYRAKWYNRHEYPSYEFAFELVSDRPEGFTKYKENDVYLQGRKISFHGKKYITKWYVRG